MLNFDVPTAVLIIDVQNVMFGDENAVYKSAEILKNIKLIEEFAIRNDLLPVYIQHDGGPGQPEEHGTEGWKLHQELLLNGEVFEKKIQDGFKDTELKKHLDLHNIKQVIICGMQSEYCILTNTKKSSELGFNTILVSDAHSTFDSEEMSALEVIIKTNKELENHAKVITTKELLSH